MDADGEAVAVIGIDKAEVDKLVSGLVERARHFELAAVRTHGDRAEEVEHAATNRYADVDAGVDGEFGRVLDYAFVGDVVAEIVDIFVEARVEIAKRPVEADAAAGAGEVARNQRVAFEFEAVDVGARRVGGCSGETVVDPVAIAVEADRTGDLHVFVLADEAGQRDGQAVVEQTGLPAQFVAVHGLRAEVEEFVLFGVANLAVAIQIGRLGTLATRVETATLEALRVGQVERVIHVRLERDRSARREFLVIRLAFEIAGHQEWCAFAVEQVGEAADESGAQDTAVARIPGVAATQRQAELVGQVIGEIAEDGPGLGRHVAQCLRVEARQADEVAGGEQRHVEGGVGVGVEVIGAKHTREAVTLDQQLQFLAQLVVLVDRGHVEVGCGQAVEIDRAGGGVLAVAGDRLYGQRVAEFVSDLERAAIGFDFLVHHVETGARVVRIVEHGRAGEAAIQQAAALARLAVVLHIVA